MKFSVSSYSFARWMMDGHTQIETVKVAKDLGFESMCFSDIKPEDGFTKEEYAKKIKEECDKCGMEISDFIFPADFIAGSDGNTDEEIKRVKGMIDIAEILGAKLVRHDATRGETDKSVSFAQDLPVLARACREVTEYAATKGIRTCVENHGYYVQDSIRMEQLFNAVNHPNFGLLCDIGNFLCVDEDPVTAVSRVAPYTIRVHAKDMHTKSGMEINPGEGYSMTRGGNYIKGAVVGHGNVPVFQCLQILKRAGYDDIVCVEYEGADENISGVRISLDNLKRFVSMLK